LCWNNVGLDISSGPPAAGGSSMTCPVVKKKLLRCLPSGSRLITSGTAGLETRCQSTLRARPYLVSVDAVPVFARLAGIEPAAQAKGELLDGGQITSMKLILATVRVIKVPLWAFALIRYQWTRKGTTSK